jgi:2-dehydro-3-deoxygluconokinase
MTDQGSPSVAFVGEAMIELTSTSPSTASWTFAGDTMNAAAAFASAVPAAKVRYITGVGVDRRSDRLIARCAELGIDASQSVRVQDRTLGLYWIDEVDGARRFQYWRNESAAQSALSAGLVLPMLDGASHIAWSGISLAVAGEGADALLGFLVRARQAGAVVAFDLNYRALLWPDLETARKQLELAIANADIVTASTDDFEILWPSATQPFSELAMSLGADEVVVTDGPGSLTSTTGAGTVTVKPNTTKTVDSTGAGDALWGSYLARRFTGHSVEDSLQGAAEVARHAVEHPGALGYLK